MRGFRFLPSALAAVAAAGALALLGSGAAQAQNCTQANAGCTQATVSVGTATTFTDNTDAISWNGSILGTQQNAAPAVSLSLSTNDPTGASITAAAFGGSGASAAGLTDAGTDVIPWTALCLQANSTGTCKAGSNGGTSGQLYASDVTAVAGTFSYSDNWELTIPASQKPGSYAAELFYTEAG